MPLGDVPAKTDVWKCVMMNSLHIYMFDHPLLWWQLTTRRCFTSVATKIWCDLLVKKIFTEIRMIRGLSECHAWYKGCSIHLPKRVLFLKVCFSGETVYFLIRTFPRVTEQKHLTFHGTHKYVNHTIVPNACLKQKIFISCGQQCISCIFWDFVILLCVSFQWCIVNIP